MVPLWKGGIWTYTQGECHVKMKAEIRVRQQKPMNTKDGQQTLEASREAWTRFSLTASEWTDFRCLANYEAINFYWYFVNGRLSKVIYPLCNRTSLERKHFSWLRMIYPLILTINGKMSTHTFLPRQSFVLKWPSSCPKPYANDPEHWPSLPLVCVPKTCT